MRGQGGTVFEENRQAGGYGKNIWEKDNKRRRGQEFSEEYMQMKTNAVPLPTLTVSGFGCQ